MSARLQVENGRRSPIVLADTEAVLAACGPEFRQLAGKRVLITGASGFIGSQLVDSLAAWNRTSSDPCQIVVASRDPARIGSRWPDESARGRIRAVAWDNRRRLSDAVQSKLDYVIHAASPVDPAEYMRAPMQTMLAIADLTRQALECAEFHLAHRILYLSSGAVYGAQPADMARLQETYCGGPGLSETGSCYAEAKRFSELLCQTSEVECVIARIFTAYGPCQSLNASFAVPSLIRQALENGRIKLRSDGRAERTFCYASDLQIGLWKILMHGEAGEVFNAGAHGPVVSIRDLAAMVARRFNDAPVEAAAGVDRSTATRYIPDCSKLLRLWTPAVTLEEGLDRMATAAAGAQPGGPGPELGG